MNLVIGPWRRYDRRMPVRAIRGATTADVDEREHIGERVIEMLDDVIAANRLDFDSVISVLFTATPDLVSVFPATVARERIPGDIPLMCAQELDTEGSLPSCIRMMMHVETNTPRAEIQHSFLQGARVLRPDLAD